jgi:capsular polysaccharide biosynthesis protein
MEVTAKDVLRVIKRFLILILTITIAFSAIAAVLTYFFDGNKNVSEVEFSCKSTSTVEDLQQHLTSDVIMNSVITEIKAFYPELDSVKLKSMVTVAQVNKTKYVKMYVVHSNSGTAYKVSVAFTNAIMTNLSSYVSGIVTEPSIETYIQSKYVRNIAIGAVIGLILSSALSVIIATSRKLVYSRSDIEKHFDLTVLGAVTKRKKQKALELLRLNVASIALNTNSKILAIAGVGKSKKRCWLVRAIRMLFGVRCDYQGLVGKELATALAGAGKKTIYIDALNKGDSQYGLNDYLQDGENKNPVLVTGNKNLFLIKSGKKVNDLTSLLSSNKMKLLLSNLAKQSECVIIDLPSMCDGAEALAVHNFVDGYVLSVKAMINSVSQVNNAVGSIKQLSSTVHGVIIEKAKKSDVYGGRLLVKKNV